VSVWTARERELEGVDDTADSSTEVPHNVVQAVQQHSDDRQWPDSARELGARIVTVSLLFTLCHTAGRKQYTDETDCDVQQNTAEDSQDNLECTH
jgi:hypothetical protein